MAEPTTPSLAVDQTLPWAAPEHVSTVCVVDTEERTLHRIDDLVEAGLLVASLLGVLLLSIYAQRTTSAVTSDVTSVISTTLRQISLVPVRILENFVTLLIPLLVLAVLAWRWQWRAILQVLAAGIAGAGVAQLVAYAFQFASSSGAFAAVLVNWNPDWSLPTVAISSSLAGLTALMRMAGERTRETYLRGCWASLWVLLGLLIIQGRMTLVSALVTVIIGATVGALARYGFGTPSQRGSGPALITALTTLGIHPETVVRVDCALGVDPVRAQRITVRAHGSSAPWRESRLRAEVSDLDLDIVEHVHTARKRVGIGAELPAYVQANRCYAVTDTAGATYLVEATDSDRLLLARLTDWWSRLRLRGTEHSESATIRDSVEHTALVWQAAHAAGARSPRSLGVARAESSYVSVFVVASPLRPLADVEAAEVTDAVLDDLWDQLRACHLRGLTHRNIDAYSVALDVNDRVNLLHWDQGEVAASDLAQRVDLVQALVLTCVLVGTDRAVAAARRALGEDTLTSLLPVIQPVALPDSTRARAKADKLLPLLREQLRSAAQVESFDVPAVDLRGFSVRTLIITTVGVAALVIVFSTLNFQDLSSVLGQATWWWLAVGYVLSLLNAPAQTVILKGVCPERLKWTECTAVQLAGSLTSLVAPSGVGVAALNLRYLNKQRVPTALGLATVSLMQAFQFVVTVALLIIFVGFTGTSISVNFFSGPLVFAVIALLAATGVFFAITPTRTWAMAKLAGPLAQIWPRVVWVMGSPRRILYATAGVIAMVVTQVGCFGCAMLAFGESLSFSTLAVTFLVSNTVGSLVPTPGGLGPIEASLTGGLQLAGISSAVALSSALTYRLLTFWGRAPVGWLALKYLQRKGIL